MIKTFKLTTIILLVAVLAGCDPGPDQMLPYKYQYFSSYDQNRNVIVYPENSGLSKRVGYTPQGPKMASTDIVVGPSITVFYVENDLVYGKVVNDGNSKESFFSVPGFFVLNTSTNDLKEGMSFLQLGDVLKIHNVKCMIVDN